MESEICERNRGAEPVKVCDYMEHVTRDCGDYVEFEVTPRGGLFNHGDKGSPEERRPTCPGIVMKFPKYAPEDMTELVKVMTQIRDEAALKLAAYILEAKAFKRHQVHDVDEVNKRLQNALNEIKKDSNSYQDRIIKICEQIHNGSNSYQDRIIKLCEQLHNGVIISKL